MKESAKNLISSPDIDQYCRKYSSSAPEFLKVLEKRTAETVGHEVMLTGPYLGKFISMMAQLLRPRYILEVGTFTSYGAICLSEALEEGGLVITVEKDPALQGFAEDIIREQGLGDKIRFITGDSTEVIPALDYEFDMAFIDAAKKNYISDYELIIPKLRPGGIILADNVLWKGSITNEEKDNRGKALDGFNQHVAQDDRVDNILIPMDDGINFIRKSS